MIGYNTSQLFLVQGDAARLPLADRSVDLVFGSPPYADARTYGEIGFNLKGQAWVDWMVAVIREGVRVSRGLVAFVVAGRTEKYRWTAEPALLLADLHRAGLCLRTPPIYRRNGVFGSGGKDWLRNDYETVVCVTPPGRLPWSDNTACGHPPKFKPGGNPSHRKKDGTRVKGKAYKPPEKANPGNVIDCGAVGGGNIGDDIAHLNEAPFPEKLADFFVRSYCPPNGWVLDPFSGSGTTPTVAARAGRNAIGLDLRHSQCELAWARQHHIKADEFNRGFRPLFSPNR